MKNSHVTSLLGIEKGFRGSGAMRNLVNVHVALDDTTFLSKSGSLVQVLKVQGVDCECLDAPEIDHIARRFGAAIRGFTEDFRLYQYLVKRQHPPLPHQKYSSPVVQAAVDDRIAHLQSRAENLYTLEIYFVICYEGWADVPNASITLKSVVSAPVDWLRSLFSVDKNIEHFDAELGRAREVLTNRVNNCVIQLRDLVNPRVLDKQEAFRFFRSLLNFAPHKIDGVNLRCDAFVDFQACGSSMECHRDHLLLDEEHVQVLTLKEAPSQTWANMLKSVQDIQAQFIIATEWKRESNRKMRRLIQSHRRHHFNSKTSLANYLSRADGGPQDVLVDDGAAALVADLGNCLRELDLEGNYFGRFSMTLIVHDVDRSRLRRAVAECFKVFSTAGAQLTEERYNLINSFFAVLPGNDRFNLRHIYLLNTNYSDLALLYTQNQGRADNPHLRSECLATLETTHGTPFFLNLHYQDIAHSLMLGATGSGKSFLLNFLLTHLQKYNPYTFVFDLGGSYDGLTRLFGGTYLHVGAPNGSVTINPFCLAPTPENLQFLLSFVRVLVESGGYSMSGADERDLYEQIGNLYEIEPSHRRLLTLAGIVNRNLRQALQTWVDGGPYGTLFDNIEDNLTLARFQTFDFEGIEQIPQTLEPLLFYVLHRANAVIYDSNLSTTFKVFVMDEAWRFFRHSATKNYIQEALKTWRKKNAAMILATQSSDDLLRSEMLPIVVESCATKMFLANPGMDCQVYREVFHLNETEADLIAGLIPKRQILIKRPDYAKVVDLNVDRKGYWLYTSDPYDKEERREAFERYGFEEGLEILARRPS